MIPGDDVEVNVAVMGGSEIVLEWRSGYVYVSEVSDTITVRRTCGTFMGLRNYHRARVRLRKRWTWAEAEAEARAVFGE